MWFANTDRSQLLTLSHTTNSSLPNETASNRETNQSLRSLTSVECTGLSAITRAQYRLVSNHQSTVPACHQSPEHSTGLSPTTRAHIGFKGSTNHKIRTAMSTFFDPFILQLNTRKSDPISPKSLTEKCVMEVIYITTRFPASNQCVHSKYFVRKILVKNNLNFRLVPYRRTASVSSLRRSSFLIAILRSASLPHHSSWLHSARNGPAEQGRCEELVLTSGISRQTCSNSPKKSHINKK